MLQNLVTIEVRIKMFPINVHGCNLFFSTLSCSCLACIPVVVFLSCCHDVSASHPLLVKLVAYMSEVLTLVGVMFVDSIYSCRLRTISTLGTVPCINSAREFIRVNWLCCLVNWLSTCRRFSCLW